MTPQHAVVSQRAVAWEDRTAWPMFALSIVFFVAWVWFLADACTSAPDGSKRTGDLRRR